jgi:conjugal transfer pilus assembly protein TraF
MPVPVRKRGRRLVAVCLLAASLFAIPMPASSRRISRSRPDRRRPGPFYCAERRLGYWFYCTKPKPPEKSSRNRPCSAARRAVWTRSQQSCANSRPRQSSSPAPENVTAYIRFQRRQLDQASLFSDVWQRAIWQEPGLDYTLQRPVSTLGQARLAG